MCCSGCGWKELTVTHDAFLAILNAAKEGRPSHKVIEVESEIVVFGQWVEVGEVEGQEVRWGHAPDGAHCGCFCGRSERWFSRR